MDPETQLLSIQRWLMFISLLLIVQTYYMASNNYSTLPGVMPLLGMLGFFVVVWFGLTFDE
ncbi:hypothetical protein KU306_00700 [Haloferax larsenii]|uniref:Uncharacterized protein n=1 Tax=Haloferax larsenii TaxID=302484 RepID=A0ABY5RHJ1_HALLR|nr:hypothetical protein [Haloferax larsenii]ELZ78248.1 hypothetical protein C455_11213 [Haloferax larsenii JCM 13917]UVE50463.1 hypothetical protein KU306_00700 [Haloferax larsenii]